MKIALCDVHSTATGKCTTCKPNHSRDVAGEVCAPCAAGHFNDGADVLCTKCDPACLTCSAAGANKCSVCADKHYISTPGESGEVTCTKCSATISNCDTCTVAATCITCEAGYTGNGTASCTKISAAYNDVCLLVPGSDATKTCAANLVCTDTTTGGEESTPAMVICLHAVDVLCNTSDAKCGTDLICDPTV